MSTKEKIFLAIDAKFRENGLHGFARHMSIAAEAVLQIWPKQRSANQNAYYHTVLVKMLADELGYQVFEMHELLKLKFLPMQVNGLDGTPRIIGGSTTKLTTKEFKDLIEKIRMWALNDLNIDLPEPPPKETDAK